MRYLNLLTLVPAATLLSACATHAVDNHYGEAWAQMQRLQTYNLRAGGASPVEGADQIQVMHALNTMRSDVADRSAVRPAPLINISQSSSSGGGSQ